MFYVTYTVCPFHMSLFGSDVALVCSFSLLLKESESVFVYSRSTVVGIVPDIPGILRGISEHSVPQLLVISRCMQVKDKDTVRIEIVVYKLKYMPKLLLIRDIVQRITGGNKCPHRPVQLKLCHILFKIEYIPAALFLCCLIQHLLGAVYTGHVISGIGQHRGKGSAATAEITHQSSVYAVFLQTNRDKGAPPVIRHLSHKLVIYPRKSRIRFFVLAFLKDIHQQIPTMYYVNLTCLVLM